MTRLSQRVFPDKSEAPATIEFKRPGRPRSLVTRDPESVIWLRRKVLKRKPVLFQFEVHLVDHCNLECKGCDRFATMCEPAFADLTEFTEDMARMAGLFSAVRRVHLVGGEPLLHPQVLEFCKVTRATFKKARITLRTNGTLLMAQDEPFWDALAQDRITLLVDLYPVDVPALEIDLMGKQRGVKVEWVDGSEKSKLPIDPRAIADPAESFRQCQGFYNRPLLRDGRLYPCAYVAFGDVFRERFRLPGLQVYPTDWIGIRDEPDPELVFSFLRNPVHWCTNCDFGNRMQFDWAPTQRHLSEWTTAPAPRPGTPPSAPGA